MFGLPAAVQDPLMTEAAVALYDIPATKHDIDTSLSASSKTILLDATTGEISVNVSDEEFARRKTDWKPRETEFGSGAIWKYAQLVGPARYGALTNPGAKGEKEQYADI